MDTEIEIRTLVFASAVPQSKAQTNKLTYTDMYKQRMKQIDCRRVRQHMVNVSDDDDDDEDDDDQDDDDDDNSAVLEHLPQWCTADAEVSNKWS